MIQLQFKDYHGYKTVVTFLEEGVVKVTVEMYGRPRSVCAYTKDSPIAGMYQRLLHDAREVEPNLFQVIGAW